MAERKRFLIVMLGGLGSQRRYEAMVREFQIVLKEALGEMPTPVALDGMMATQIWLAASERDAQAIGSAIMARLRGRPLFMFRDDLMGADKLAVIALAEVGGDFASDTAMKMALGLG